MKTVTFPETSYIMHQPPNIACTRTGGGFAPRPKGFSPESRFYSVAFICQIPRPPVTLAVSCLSKPKGYLPSPEVALIYSDHKRAYNIGVVTGLCSPSLSQQIVHQPGSASVSNPLLSQTPAPCANCEH